MHPGGRPQKTIDWEEFDKLCQLQCTKKEMASFLEVDENTIDAILLREKGVSFSVYFEQKAAGGKRSLRRRQFQAAEEGSPAMLIWLGKQWLGQTDKVETKEVEPIKLGYDPNDLPKPE
jgi:hypothetical protein